MDPRTPGQMISTLLKERGWTKRTLAIVLGVDEATITRLVSDKRPVSADLALQLEEVLGVEADRLLTLQKDYDLQLAKIAFRSDPARAVRAQIFGTLPIVEMVKRGWLPGVENPKDVPAVEAAVAKFFEAPTVGEVEFLPHAARRTQTSVDATPLQLAWLYRVKSVAAEMMVPPYSDAKGRAVVERLRSLLSAAEEARKVPRLLAEAGIRLVIVEALPSSKIDGACLWLNATSPVIALSFRFDRIDNFWFVLRHELEHVLQHHGQVAPIVDVDLDGRIDAHVIEEERIANAAAAAFAVPPEKLSAFVARKAPFFAERDILGFASTLGVHPGLVAGQLQHRTQRYNHFRSHLVKIRSIVAPGAMVDGWGDVAPVGL
ncbi:HigA family addiction module antidote protein [Luteimonas marina]|uniref:HigA family addiction module antidote protein n=1 Tax=Luteimonas marina TaxID=488485 RepID=A0A5C5UC54_9GAMM|nr:HigA family addiction module antitoxin [Luteimonas marina]TWT23664.1 HigA family addiction module antidote protein [Luteimonas marina]